MAKTMKFWNRLTIALCLVISAGAFAQTAEAQTCGPDTMSLRGSHNSWQTDAMSCDEERGVWVSKGIHFSDVSLFIFDVKANWQRLYGAHPSAAGKTVRGGENILIERGGIYNVEFNFIKKRYRVSLANLDAVCGSKSMTLRSSHADWNPMPMSCEGGWWIAKNVVMPANSAVKFDRKGNWEEVYGDALPIDLVADLGGAEIQTPDPGVYDVKFNYLSKVYQIGKTEHDGCALAQSSIEPDMQMSTAPSILEKSLGTKSKHASSNACEDACYRQYNRDTAGCRRIRNVRGRGICWASIMTKYGWCLANCR